MNEDLHSRLGRMEGKMDMMIDQLEVYASRLGFLEKIIYWAWGAGIIIASILGIYVMEIKQAVAKVIGGPG